MNFAQFLYLFTFLIAGMAGYTLGIKRVIMFAAALLLSAVAAVVVMSSLYFTTENPLSWHQSFWDGLHVGAFLLGGIYVIEKAMIHKELTKKVLLTVSVIGTAITYLIWNILLMM